MEHLEESVEPTGQNMASNQEEKRWNMHTPFENRDWTRNPEVQFVVLPLVNVMFMISATMSALRSDSVMTGTR